MVMSSTEYRKLFTVNLCLCMETVNVVKLVSFLQMRSIISEPEGLQIVSYSTHFKRNNELYLILGKKDPQSFETIVEGLRKTRNDHIANKLQGIETNKVKKNSVTGPQEKTSTTTNPTVSYEQFREIVAKNLVQCTKNLKNLSQLIYVFQQQEIFSDRESKLIENKNSDFEKTIEIFQLLLKKGSKRFWEIIDSLRKTENGDIADTLAKDLTVSS